MHEQSKGFWRGSTASNALVSTPFPQVKVKARAHARAHTRCSLSIQSETPLGWEYFDFKFVSDLEERISDCSVPWAPLYDGGTVLKFSKQTAMIDDTVKTSLVLLDDI